MIYLLKFPKWLIKFLGLVVVVFTLFVFHHHHILLFDSDKAKFENSFENSQMRTTTTVRIRKVYAEEYGEILNYFAPRRQLLNDKCREHLILTGDSGAFRISRKRWFHFKRENVSIKWCPVYKAGSSSWMALFSWLSGALNNRTEKQLRETRKTLVDLAANFRLLHPIRPMESIEKGETKMLIVRHPFKRLLSAYRDKLEKVKGREFYHNSYGKFIASRFRRKGQPSSSELNKDNSPPTFLEFCGYLVSQSNNPGSMDEHWRPQYLDCSLCRIKYDLILKVEEMESDKQQVLQLLRINNLSSSENDFEDIMRRWSNEVKSNSTSDLNESYYFSQLSRPLMALLYRIYELDFKLLGYSAESYFDMISNGK